MEEIMKKNKNTLQMASVYNNSLKNLRFEGNYLILNNKKVDVSNFDIAILLGNELPLFRDLNKLTDEDFYRIVSIHATMLNAKLEQDKIKSENEKKLEALKQKNPLLKDITISHHNNIDIGEFREYINIVDKNNVNHVFYNKYKLDLLEIYMDAIND